jgi:tetratricopeptide (TPR) repeat protein
MMSKLDHLRQKKLNPADELRALLNSLEDTQAVLKSLDATQTLNLLKDLDQVYDLLSELEVTGAELASERGRFGAIQAFYKSKVSFLLGRLGGPAALSTHRPKPEPERERWWWYIHEMVAAQQQRFLRYMMISLVAVLGLLGAVYLLFNTILAPSPEAVARVEAENEALAAYDEADYARGLAAVEKGLAVVPDDPALLLLKGAFYEALNQPEQAAQVYEEAKQKTNPPINFYLGRAQLYLRINQSMRAEEDARAALALDDKAALAWLLLGQALESQERRFEAISAYETAGNIAMESGDSQIVVLARLALGRITSTP